ncbi:MAG: HAD-IC family P-type ATPase [Deltaproteobacteria bacterium]|nr:HAD-IC family P-type ATPase [Deltaproteobacteria bacterium]
MTTQPPSIAAPTSSTLWHTLAASEVAARLSVDPSVGLTRAEVDRRLKQHGPNVIGVPRGRGVLRILIAQFQSVIVVLLAVATALAFALEETIQGFAVLGVLVINGLIGFFTEWSAERSLVGLRQQTAALAHVVREGHEQEIAAAALVPGDIVILRAGAKVPADGRVIEEEQLQVQESALTGEATPVSKTREALPDAVLALGDRTNVGYLGSVVTTGRGRMIVTGTGRHTEVGTIGKLLEETHESSSPLELKLAELGRRLVGLVGVLTVIIVAVGWLRGHTLLAMVEVGIALAIAAVPEGLPAVATITLALGMRRMAEANALVRRLPAVETLGATTVICTDKTGTLTTNEMTARVMIVGERRIEVRGSGYALDGGLEEGSVAVPTPLDDDLTLALQIGALCNDAEIDREGDRATVLGDPTEGALVVLAEKAGLPHVALEAALPRVAEIPFETALLRMLTVHTLADGTSRAFVKGAPRVLLDASVTERVNGVERPLEDARRAWWLEENRKLAASAMRVLALATRSLPAGSPLDDAANGLTFVGLVGIEDAIRPEARAAIATCREAGIRTIMITGDQEVTAVEIARQIGLAPAIEGQALRATHSRDLVDLDAAAWDRVVRETTVFARVSPEQKLRIVEALQRQGHVVAMTGDGANDAPALKRADIGIAMGIQGTDVAKDAADMVVLDDDFATIVAAVEQGRILYANIVRFVHYLFSCNLAEILTVFLAITFAWPVPLVALQILWLNIITDVFPALALALEPSASGAMRVPPRDPHEPIVPRRLALTIGWQGLLIAAVSLTAFAIGRERHGDADGSRAATTMVFMTLSLAQLFHAFSARSRHRSILGRGMFSNVWLWVAVGASLALQVAAVFAPPLQRLLHTAAPSAFDWAVIVCASLTPVLVVECVKLATRVLARREAKASSPPAPATA